jgi:CHAT domain-containing protein/Flp pilus assembly protein TadD
MAERMAKASMQLPSHGQSQAPPSNWWTRIVNVSRLSWATGIATVLALLAWTAVRFLVTPDIDSLLATAYTEQRTMEVRIPGAAYAPIRQERNAARSTLDQPQALLEANALIAKRLKDHPDDPRWLQAKGRADLLAFRYEAAIPTLERALNLQPNSPELLTDLATAHFQRAQANSGREIDYGTAIEYLGRALAKNPDDPVVLFNRAVAEEKLRLYLPSITDWNHYLKVDPSGPWADEARRKLGEVRKKVEKKQSSLHKPLLTVSQIFAFQDSEQVNAELDSRVEQYLQASLTDWQARAFSTGAGTENPRLARSALRTLAEVLRHRHHDFWLTELLDGPQRPPFAKAVEALSAAVRANNDGDYSHGREWAHASVRYFRASANVAGELRAQAEEVYSDHLIYDGRSCRKLATSILTRLHEKTYPWLEAQTYLESANCNGLIGNLGQAQTDIARGTKLAQDHAYPSLFLRGLGFQADTAGVLGNAGDDFSLASAGLDVFWEKPIDIMKGYNLYTDLDTAADVLRLPNLQMAIWQQATALIDLHPDLVQRAMAHRWFASSAYAANAPDLAEEEFEKASALFSAAPPTEATSRGKVDAEISLAELQVRRGDFDKASRTLQRVESVLPLAPSFGLQIGFYSAQSQLSLRKHDAAKTESALRSAIYLSEWALRSFPSRSARREWAGQSDLAYRTLVSWALENGDSSAALEFWEWYRGAEFRSEELTASHRRNSFGPALPPTPEDAPPVRAPTVVKDRLPLFRQETVLTYAVFPTGIEIWMYDDRGESSAWVATPEDHLQELALRFIHLSSEPHSELAALRSSGRALYDLLIAPIESRLLPNRMLVFELDDLLSEVPMDALVDREGRYLVQRATIAFAPSVYQSLRLHPGAPIGPQSHALIISVPVVRDDHLAPLIEAESEAKNVAANFQSPVWLTGNAANISAIRGGLARAHVFHFVGHAMSSPGMVGLILAEQDPRTRRPRLLDSANLDAGAVRGLELAVLSACETGRIVASRTPTDENLATALLRFGVPHVVASRWNVDSAETSELMRVFYQHLTAGDGVAGSLHSAQLTLLQKPSSAHPYYWAAFGVQGSQSNR